ncbi:MAG: ABC transporter permease [Candidatus Binatia bacterium]
MTSFLVRRLVQTVPLLLLISLFAFLVIRLAGDPMSMYGLNPNMTADDQTRIITEHGWDQPIVVQYFYWLRDALRGDWGHSLYTYEPVAAMILARLPNTLILMGSVFIVTLLVSIPLGIYTATHPHSPLDHVITGTTFLAYALPTFWLGLVAIMVFSVKFKQWGLPSLPAGGTYNLRDGPSLLGLLQHLILPCLVLSVVSVASYIRYLRAGMLEVLNQDYVRTARAKGVREGLVVWKHAFKNAALPLITLISLNIPRIFSGALITEQVFAWPGMGRLFVDHATRADYPVLMGLVISVSLLVAAFSLLADIAYAYIDPRIRLA